MFNILVDTREQQPWDLQSAQIDKTISHKLDTGDYTIEGFENILCIERKKSVAEIAGNLTSQRFERELERMSVYPYAFLILEFGISDILSYPVGSSIPPSKWKRIRIRGKYIMSELAKLSITYDVHVWYCNNTKQAELAATHIMKQVYYAENE